MLSVILVALLQAAPAAPAPPKLGTLFIAPSGEPFRGVAGEAYPVATWFARADADKDGKLTRGEFRRDAMTFFPALDVDRDGIVDAKEIARYEEVVVPEVRVAFGDPVRYRIPSAGGYPEGDPSSQRVGGFESTGAAAPKRLKQLPDLPRGAGRYALINAPQPVVSADTDLNRRITEAEMGAAADRRFTLLDPDARGFLTLAGLPQTPMQKRGERR